MARGLHRPCAESACGGALLATAALPSLRGGAYTYDWIENLLSPSLIAKVGMIPIEPASLVMERKLLRGIKQHAERLAADAKEQTLV